LDSSRPEVAKLYYDLGKLYFSEYEGTMKDKAVNAKNYFEFAVNSSADFDKKKVAECYYSICKFKTDQSKTTEHSIDDYKSLFSEIKNAEDVVSTLTDGGRNYDKISLYYTSMLMINDQAESLTAVDFDKSTVLDKMESIYKEANAIRKSDLSYVNNLKKIINDEYDNWIDNIEAKYNEAEKNWEGD
jgi:hypothetical protein